MDFIVNTTMTEVFRSRSNRNYYVKHKHNSIQLCTHTINGNYQCYLHNSEGIFSFVINFYCPFCVWSAWEKCCACLRRNEFYWNTVVILASLVDIFADSLVLYYCTRLFVDQRILVAEVYYCTRCFSYSRRHGSKKRQRQTPKKLEDDDSKYFLFILIIAIVSIYLNRDRATGGREIQILTWFY